MTKGDKKRDEVLDELVGLFEEQQLSLEDIRERCDQYPEFADDIMGMWQILSLIHISEPTRPY